MKKPHFLFCFIMLTLISNCKNDDDILIPEEEEEEIVLTDNIEVYDADSVENSLVLAIENGGTEAYLLNKSGNRVYEWTFDTRLGNDLELLPDGKLIGMFKAENPSINFGGYGGVIKIINIDGTINWEYTYSSTEYLAHHDVEMLPNGNVLFLAWEKVSAVDA